MPWRILVVEDHAPFRRITCEALEFRGDLEIFEAADGAVALQKALELQPDLVLLDINLPKLDGFRVAARMADVAPQARLLFMSQESSADIVRQAFRLGAQGYIHKHRAGTDLLDAVDAVLSGRRFVSAGLAAPHCHEILFCPDDAAVVNGLTRFVAAALNAGDAAVVLATESHRIHLLLELRARDVDVGGAIESGTYVSFEADEAPDRAGFLRAIDDVREAAVRAGKAHPRIALCGERAGRLWASGRIAEAAALEQFCSELPHDIDILCLYPVAQPTDAETLEQVCAGHTVASAS